MGDYCDLHAANGQDGVPCEGEECPYWRVVEQIGDTPGSGCAIRYYELTGKEGMAAWLLSVRERLERVARADSGRR